jgi:hypothetical protein
MALLDRQEPGPLAGPRTDGLGIGCFLFHMSVGAYVLVGWIVSCQPALLLYLALLPAMATTWRLNRHSCILNNLESFIRSGRWRDPESREEAAFLLMLCDWLFKARPHELFLNRLSYAAVSVLWLLALSHFSWLSAA